MKILHCTLVFLALALPPVQTFAGPSPASARHLVNRTRAGLAIQGYDPVAYFTAQKAMKGLPAFTADHDGATYQFSSAEHRALFLKDPAKYAPAFGGYCGYAASINRLSPIDPAYFQVIEGKLILQHNQKALDKWNADLAGNLTKANSNWPGLVAKNGTVGQGLTNLDKQGVALAGYDPVSYFTDGKPAQGDPKIEATYNGALYHFASQEHRASFESDPTKYLPAYGGYCGYAASIGKVRPIDPKLWSIVDGQLILQHSKGAVELWQKAVAANKTKADAYWPRLEKAKAGQKDPLDGLLGKSVLPDVR